jgi:HEAT repeat protein
VKLFRAILACAAVAGCARHAEPPRLSPEATLSAEASLGRIRRGAGLEDSYAIEDGLVALGDAAVPLLAAHVADADDDVRFHCVRALGRLKSRGALPALVEALHDRRSATRIEAIDALAEIADGSNPVETTELVARFANDADPVVKNAAAWALWKLGWRVGVPVLVENLDAKLWPRWDADRKLREIAGRDVGFDAFAGETDRRAALATWREWRDGFAPMFDDLVRCLGLYKFLLSDWAKKALIKLGPPAVPRLRRALDDESPYVRTHAIEALEAIGAPVALDDVRRRLRDPFAPARAAAASALGALGDPDPGADLARAATGDVDPSVRCAAVASLARLATPATIAPLARALERDAGVGEIAAAAREGLRRADPGAGLSSAIAALDSSDAGARDEARKRLRELLGDATPSDPAAWWRSIEPCASAGGGERP